MTYWDEAGRRTTGGLTILTGKCEAERRSWSEVISAATGIAARLRRLGIQRGAPVAVTGPTSHELVSAILGCIAAGSPVAVLPPEQVSFASHQLLLQTIGAQALLRALGRGVIDLARLAEASDGPGGLDPSTLVLQFTSGSTRTPRAVAVAGPALVANLDAISSRANMCDGDVFVSWLPLYHDMGLIGMLLLPMWLGAELVLADTANFVRNPFQWMRWIAEFRGTVTTAPDSAYRVAAAALRRGVAYDLSSLRVAVNGSEPIFKRTVESFADAGERHGIDARAICCVYGLAECTLAVTMPPAGSGFRAHGLGSGSSAVLLGPPVGDTELRVDALDGELFVRGSSTANAYLAGSPGEIHPYPDWIATGDVATVSAGELVVHGRAADGVKVNGHRIWCADVEELLDRLGLARSRSCCVFPVSLQDRTALSVVVEASTLTDERREGIRRAVRRHVGVTPYAVMSVGKGAIPRTSSGKKQRWRCVEAFEGEVRLGASVGSGSE